MDKPKASVRLLVPKLAGDNNLLKTGSILHLEPLPEDSMCARLRDTACKRCCIGYCPALPSMCPAAAIVKGELEIVEPGELPQSVLDDLKESKERLAEFYANKPDKEEDCRMKSTTVVNIAAATVGLDAATSQTTRMFDDGVILDEFRRKGASTVRLRMFIPGISKPIECSIPESEMHNLYEAMGTVPIEPVPFASSEALLIYMFEAHMRVSTEA